MNLPLSPPGGGEPAPVYRFANVAVDVLRQQLWVDGVEVACQPLAFRLLVMLCEARGALVSRQLLFERLWPGGQDISDTALTQLIWRLRGALGPAADAIRTVRRGGIRLDAVVALEAREVSITAAAPGGVAGLRGGALPGGVAVSSGTAAPGEEDAAALAVRASGEASVVADAGVPPGLAVQADARPVTGVYTRAQPALSVATAVADTAGKGASRRWRQLLLAATTLAALLAAAAWWLLPRNVLVSSEYALHVDDLDASRSDTAELLRLAFAAVHDADIGRARQLLIQVADMDTQSPVAPALLAIHSFSDPARVGTWAALAQQRVRAQTPPYTRLLVQLAQHYREPGDAARQIEEAMLDLRPQAWRLHLALAHQYMARRQFSQALAAYRRVPLDQPGPGVIVYVLSDRASLGDADAIAAELASGLLRHDPGLQAYVQARLAYTRGQWQEAISAAERAQSLAEATRAQDNATNMAELAAVAALMQGSSDAAERFQRLLSRCDTTRSICRARTLGFLAVLAAQANESDLAGRYMDEAWPLARQHWERAALQAVTLAFNLPRRQDTATIAAAIEPGRDFAGNAELLRAWQAFVDGDIEGAKHRLATARSEGVADTYFTEYALLLGARLGEAPQGCVVDPPFPGVLRAVACVALHDLLLR
jgi:DNA-binding winged helix-turn-helix (wHTH) protein/tetratricopeptide (TPR) repeat protein